MCDSHIRMTRLLFIAALLAATPLAQAQDDPAPEGDDSRFQVAVHAGYRAGGSLEDVDTGDERDLDEGEGFAVALEMRHAEHRDRWFQLWYSRQSTAVEDELVEHDVDVEYLHLGGTIPVGSYPGAQPYFSAGLGATRFSASGPDADDEIKFSGSIAFGVAVPIGENIAFRAEARGYLTMVDSDSAFFCRSDGGEGLCRIVASGSTIGQVEALAGIVFRF